MAKFYDRLTPELQTFIEAQHIFFVATAPHDGRVNLSSKECAEKKGEAGVYEYWQNKNHQSIDGLSIGI